MTFSDNTNFESYVPVYTAIPEEWEDARPILVEQMKLISNAVNIREIGWFLDVELLSGKQFIPSAAQEIKTRTNATYRSVLRKIIDFGTLPNAGAKSVAHGITFDNNFTLVQLYGAATAPSAPFRAIPLPFVGVPIDSIELYMDDIDVWIITSSDRTNFTRCFVTIEYMQEI